MKNADKYVIYPRPATVSNWYGVRCSLSRFFLVLSRSIIRQNDSNFYKWRCLNEQTIFALRNESLAFLLRKEVVILGDESSEELCANSVLGTALFNGLQETYPYQPMKIISNVA